MTTASVPAPTRKYITVRTLGAVEHRVKPLPPDANATASTCTLYQLAEHVEFRCYRCRKDGVFADAVAADETSGLMMCQSCYARMVRPRQYRPTRMVPFPSLMSWLTYKPPSVATAVSQDVLQRPAEAALPSGRRVAMPEMITAAPGASTIHALPATPLNPLGGALDPATRLLLESQASHSEAAREAIKLAGVHPCMVDFGVCQHGSLCFFARAPTNVWLPYLMGLCDSSACPAEKVAERVFELPPSNDPRPPRRAKGDDAQRWLDWVSRRVHSQNQAEWQLWNQPWTTSTVDRFVPWEQDDIPAAQEADVNRGDAPHVEPAAEPVAAASTDENGAPRPATASDVLGVDLNAIRGALSALRKKRAADSS